MTRRALIFVCAAFTFIGSCNPLGGSQITSDRGTPVGLTPACSPADGSSTPLNPIPMTVTWTEGVTGFALTDMQITNGTATAMTGGNKTFVFTLTPSAEGSVT